MGDYGWWGMVEVGIWYRMGIGTVVLRWDCVTRRVESGHDGGAEEKCKTCERSWTLKCTVDWPSSTSFEVPEMQGSALEGPGPGLDDGSVAKVSGMEL